MSNAPSQGMIVFSAKNNLRLSVNPSNTSTMSDEVFAEGEQIGKATGQRITIANEEWFSINVIVSQREVSPWFNVIPVLGQVAYFGGNAVNLGYKTSDFWLKVDGGDYFILDTPEGDATQATSEAAAAALKRKQALVDAVASNNNPNLTANGSGTTSSSNYVWWIVGVVLFLIAALVVWRLAKRSQTAKQASTQQPKPTTLSGIKRPKRLR